MAETFIFISYSPADKTRSLVISSEEEVNAFIQAQERNQFIPEENRVIYDRIGSAADILKQPETLGENIYFDLLNITTGDDCQRLNFSSLTLFSFKSLAVNNKCVFLNETFPILRSVEELVLGKSVVGTIDFSKFPDLKSVTLLQWSQKFHFTGENNVGSLTIWGLNPKIGKTFDQFQPFINLKELTLNRAICVDLQGIEAFHRLSKLDVNYATKLKNIESISRLGDLVDIRFDVCKKIEDFSPLGACKNLSKVAISNCNVITGLDFLLQLTRLKRVVILNTKTNVEDTSVIVGLQKRVSEFVIDKIR